MTVRETHGDVLVIGAGPVGMVLAGDLADRGVRVTVLEQRHQGEPPSVKCNHVAARTMEAFRRLGFVEQVRSAGLPANHAHDVAFRTSTVGTEFGRIKIPSSEQRYTATDAADAGWPTPEPPHRINQIYLEPIMDAHVRALPEVEIINRVRCVEVSQDSGQVLATVEDLDDGSNYQLSAPYLVGCDGGSSVTRHAINATFHGNAVISRVQSTYILAPALMEHFQAAPAWGTFSFNPRRSGMVYAIDGKGRFLIHNYLREDEEGFDAVDRDCAMRTILGVEADFPLEVISQEDWFGRRLVADKFADERIFIAGDAAHLWVPYAGYGMNAGIADALDLSWMLAATTNGWGGPGLLAAYEAERLPITEQVSHYAMNQARTVAAQRRVVPSEIEDDTAAGELARQQLGERAYEANVAQYAAAGLNFGYYYDHSPVIVYDGTEAPSYSMGEYTPSTVPGCRVPHLWQQDGSSLYDLLGSGLTLLSTAAVGAESERERLAEAAAGRAIPFTIVDVDGPDAERLYESHLVLSRPDGHIAWRGQKLPADLDALLNHVTGRPLAGLAAAALTSTNEGVR